MSPDNLELKGKSHIKQETKFCNVGMGGGDVRADNEKSRLSCASRGL